jgi:ribosomal protein S18
MFGRKMNKFINYNIADKTISESAISIRLTEIKQMFEETIPKAIENIQDSQKIQINSQNSSHHIQEQLLKIDDEVYIKVLKIHPKIDPDYVGPYFIDGITRKHNYWLRDKDGKRQACALPLSRLKLVEKLIPTEKLTDPKINIDDTFYDIETIIMDRQRNKKKEFYVKWLNLDDSQNSWVPLENFKSPDMIKEYFVNKRKIKKQTNTINIQTNQANIVQINFPVNTHIINVNTVVKLFTFFILMINTSATILSDNFMYCQINTNKKLLDINNICKIDTIQQKELISPSNSTELLILAKLHNIVNGIGFECKKSVTSRFLKENIFN